MSDSHRAGHVFGDITAERSRMLLGDDLSTNHNSFVFNVAGAPLSEVDRKAAILAALAYHDMNAKRNRLAVKLAETKAEHFEWIWDVRAPDSGTDKDIFHLSGVALKVARSRKTPPGFVPWLASKSPIFWISGKPASGKSTLMRFVSRNERCFKILESASGRKWHMIDFFFDYRLHKHEANTVEGMFKSLLSQLIKGSPTISQHIACSSFGDSLGIRFHEASLLELRSAIESAIAFTDCRVCIFVDGLDEFEGSFHLLIAYLKSLADGERVKICLASRPDVELKHALTATPGIRMQDYNISTIGAYVEDSLSEYAHYLPEAVLQRLIDKISQGSDGVILWSQLVCGDVIQGMLAHETETELRARIATFPQELHEVYDRLLQQRDSRFTTETALILRLLEARRDGRIYITVLQRTLEWLRDQRLLVSYPSQYLTRRSFIARLEARLGGLIDIVPERTAYGGPRVEIIHKTLSSYLENSSILTTNLPAEFATSYSDFVWERLYAAFIRNSRVFDTWPFEEVLQMTSECYEVVRADTPTVEQDVSSAGVLAAKDWTWSQVSLAKECIMLFEAFFELDYWDYPEDILEGLRYSVLYSDAMCLHLMDSDSVLGSNCFCAEVTALKPSESKLAFLRLPAHQRAFWFSLEHRSSDEADRILSSLDQPSELLLTLCHELYCTLQETDSMSFHHMAAWQKDVIEKLFQRWWPEWCKPNSNHSVCNTNHSTTTEANDTNSKSIIETDDNVAEPSSEDTEDDDDDGGVLCPPTP